jgi:hypothetical protein
MYLLPVETARLDALGSASPVRDSVASTRVAARDCPLLTTGALCNAEPPRCATCQWPSIPDKDDCTKCACPPPYVSNNGKCEQPPECPTGTCCDASKNEILVRGCKKSSCECKSGYTRCGGNCVPACKKGETLQADCTCKVTCPGNLLPDLKGNCVCDKDYVNDGNNNCVRVKECKPNELFDEYVSTALRGW